MKNNKFMTAPFEGSKNLARLVAVFLIFFAFKAEAQNNALNFNSINNYVTCGNSIGNFGTSDFTIEFNILTTSNTGNALAILSKRSICNHTNFINLTLKGGNFEFEIDQDTNGTNYTSLQSSGGALVNDGLWHHVALIRSGTTLKFYIDGIAAGSTTASGIANISNSTYLTIGKSICDNYLNGSLDELRIWNVARTQSQIQSAMDTGLVGNETGLITYYNFNQGTANNTNTGVTTLNDSTSNSNNGTLSNFSLSGSTSNWVSGAVNPTVAGTVSANQTITSSTGSGTSLVPIDKNLDGGGYANVGNGWFGQTNQAQSFKASISTSWKSLKINVLFVVNPGDITLKVFSGNGVNGTLLHSQNVIISDSGINTITFLNPIALTAGQDYTFLLTDNGSADIYLDASYNSSLLFPHYENGNLTGGPLYFENAYQINNANWNNLTLTGNTGNVLYWQKSTNAGFTNPTNITNTSTTLYSGLIGNLSATTYFRALVKFGGFPAAYTNTVTISASTNTVNTTKLKADLCGATLTSLKANITADRLPLATEYRFKVVVNGGDPQVLETGISRSFKLTSLTAGASYSTAYTVSVAAKLNGVWGNYGADCVVTTPAVPTTKVQTSQCGQTLPALNTTVNAIVVFLATEYRFTVTTANGLLTEVIESGASRGFKLTSLTWGARYNTAYTVSVEAKYNGVWGLPGEPCVITTSAAPFTKVRATQCGQTLPALNTTIIADNLLFATDYSFKVVVNGDSYEVNPAGNSRSFKLTSLPVPVIAGTTYKISVAAQHDGIWGDYGTECDVTTPGIAPNARQMSDTTSIETIDYSLVAYPNPSNSTFNLKVNGANDDAVSILVFDMTGRQIENKVVKANEIENISLGQNYSTGVYNVIVSQGMNTKTVRLVKQ